MPIKISTTNTKLGLIPSINLPPIITCRANTPCSKGCYATKGRFCFNNVKESLQNNLNIYTRSPDFYFDSIVDYLSSIISYKYFRWHSAGDIVDESYFKGVVSIAKRVPQTSFLMFTKKFEIVNAYTNQYELPDNLHIVYSAWGSFIPINPHSFPIAYIRFKNEDIHIPKNATECKGDCTNCLSCWEIQRGECVVFNKH